MLCHKLESSMWNFLYMLLMTCKCPWYILCETRPRGCRVMPFFSKILIYPHFLWQSTISNSDNSTLYCQPDSTFYNQQRFKLKYHLNIILALCNDKCIIDVIFKNLKYFLCSSSIQLLVNFSMLLDDNVLPVLIIGESALLIG